MKKTLKPPLGVKPRWLFEEARIAELQAAIERFLSSNWPIPMEMVKEYNELVGRLPFDNE